MLAKCSNYTVYSEVQVYIEHVKNCFFINRMNDLVVFLGGLIVAGSRSVSVDAVIR